MDEYTASQYVEFNVVKINRHGSRQHRIVGIDRDKIYNLPPQHCLGMNAASLLMVGRTKTVIRDHIMYSFRNIKNNGIASTKKAFKLIKHMKVK